MKMMQTRFDADTITTIIAALEAAPDAALTAHQHVTAAELAAKLRYRCIRLWGAGYAAGDNGANAQDTPLPFATMPLKSMP